MQHQSNFRVNVIMTLSLVIQFTQTIKRSSTKYTIKNHVLNNNLVICLRKIFWNKKVIFLKRTSFSTINILTGLSPLVLYWKQAKIILIGFINYRYPLSRYLIYRKRTLRGKLRQKICLQCSTKKIRRTKTKNLNMYY